MSTVAQTLKLAGRIQSKPRADVTIAAENGIVKGNVKELLAVGGVKADGEIRLVGVMRDGIRCMVTTLIEAGLTIHHETGEVSVVLIENDIEAVVFNVQVEVPHVQ